MAKASGKPVVKKGKKQKKKKPTSKRWANYEVSGSTLKRKNITCPKCGKAIQMAEHKNRRTCGKCGYTEFKGKKKEE